MDIENCVTGSVVIMIRNKIIARTVSSHTAMWSVTTVPVSYLERNLTACNSSQIVLKGRTGVTLCSPTYSWTNSFVVDRQGC